MRKASKWARALMVYILCIAITFTMTPVNLIAWGADETNQQTEQAQEAVSEDVQQDGQNAEQFGENDQTSSDESEDQAEEPPADDQNAAADVKADNKEEATDTDNAKSDAVTNNNADNDAADPKGKESVKEDSDKVKEKAKDEYPATELSGSAGSVSVSIRAPKGALPKGAKVKVESVNKADVIIAADDVVDGKIKDAKAANITFYDKDGNKIEPKKAVNVSFNASGLALGKNQNVYVVHIADSGGAEIVDASVSGTNAKFSTDEFSTYGEILVKNAEPSEDAYTVNFRNRDGDIIHTRQVVKGEAVGKLPDTIAREDYTAYWAIGTGTEGSQGTVWTAGDRIDENFVPEADTDIVPDYDKIEYTVSFYENEDDTEATTTKKVDVDTSYCLNDIPDVPAKSGYTGKWVYSGGDFNNNVIVKEDTKVWAEYDKNVFTVTFKINAGDENAYQTDTFYKNDELTLPTEPTVDGKEFVKWVDSEGTEYKGGEAVTSDLTLTAEFKEMYAVNFVVVDDGTVKETLSQYFRTAGEKIGAMPQDPFVSGKVFQKWVVADVAEDGTITPTETEVNADTVVNGKMTVVAVFRDITVYNITAEYYYLNDNGDEVIFTTDLLQVEASELPYTITAPASTKTDEDQVDGAPIYYPETPTVEVKKDNFDNDKKCTVRVQYVKYTAKYDFVYKLKDLTGDGYTEIEGSREHVQGVLGSQVTPTIKTFDYATLEEAETAVINQAEGQEVVVKYKRKNFQLSYDTNGGSYVAGGTYKYGESATLSSTMPTREGYDFEGWYSDKDLTNKVTGSVKIEGDTTLYAKWTPKTVNYTIVYMFEKFNDAGTESSYVYDNSKDAEGTVGTKVQASDAPAMTKTGWEKDTAKNAESEVVIAADGSSVLYVYYKLTEYTFHFRPGTYVSGWNAYNVTASLNGESKTGNIDYSYIFTAKLGQDISSLWLNASDGTYTSSYGWSSQTHNVSFRGWIKTNSNTVYVTKRFTLTEDMLPDSGTAVTYQGSWLTDSVTYTVNYWFQNADDNGYTKSDIYSQTYQSSSGGSLEPKDISGYTYDHRVNSGWHPGGWGQNDWYDTVDFYYNRDKYKIDYYYGSKKLDAIEEVKFDANINKSPYVWTPTATECDVDSDYTFDGWYSDSGLTSEYQFGTMPASNLVLYAKWNAPKYNVKFVDDDGTTELADSVTVEKYKKVSAPETQPTKAGYTFDGWFTSADGDDLFDWNTQITEDTTIYAHWTQNTLSYTVHYVDEDGNPVADDKVVTNPNLKVDQTITEQAIAVAGYRPDASSKDLKLKADASDNQITFVYSTKADSTSYKVRYLLDPKEYGEDIAVAEEKIVPNVPGDTASVIELAASVDYDTLYAAHSELKGVEFFPDKVEKTLVLTVDENENVLTFYYSGFKHANVKVNYVDMEGNKIADSDKQILKVGKTFTLSRTPIAGWELNKAVEGDEYTGEEADSTYKITESVCDDGLEFTLFYQKKATITAASASKQYDGTALTMPTVLADQVTVEGLKDGHSLESIDFAYKNTDTAEGATPGRINAGTATVTPKDAVINGASDNYYKIRYISGTLDVSKINVTVRIEPDRWTGNTYNGTVKQTGFTNGSKTLDDYIIISHKGYKDEYQDEIWNSIKALDQVVLDESAAGLKYYVLSEKDAGDYIFKLGDYFNTSNLPQDDNYSVNLYVRDARLQINPKPVAVTTGSKEKSYDGTPLLGNTALIDGKSVAAEINGLVAGETAGIEATGTITDPGEINNSYSITWGDDGALGGILNEYTAKQSNYTVTENLGTLKIKKAPLSIRVKDKTSTYNGAEQSGHVITDEVITCTGETIETDDYKITGLAKGDKLTVNYSAASGTNAGEYTNGAFGDISIEGKNLADYYELTKTKGKLMIDPKAVTITAKDASKAYDGKALTESGFTATALEEGDSHTFTVTMTEDSTITNVGTQPNVIATVDGEKVTAGTAKQIGNYTVTTVNGTLTITQDENALVIGSDTKAWTYDGRNHKSEVYTVKYGEQDVTAKENSAGKVFELPNGDVVTITATADGVTNVSDTAPNNNTYTYTVTRDNEDATTNYKSITANIGTLTITPKAVTITTGSASKPYDGAALTESTATIDGLVNNETATVTATGTITEVGNTPNTYSIDWGTTDKDNYTVTENLGTLTVTESSVEVTLTAPSDSKTYDSTALKCDGTGEKKVTAGGLPEGFTVEATASGSQTDAGSSANKVNDGFVIKNADGVDKTANFTNVKKIDGTLTVNKAPITITTGTDTKVFDGMPLTKAEASITGLVNDETATVTATGTITEVGNTPNTYNIEWGTAKAENYVITEALGTLTITENTSEITLTAPSDSKTYDGTALTADGTGEKKVTATGLPTGPVFVVQATATGSQTNAGSSANTVDSGYKILLGGELVDVTDSFTNIKTVNGTLTVETAPVTIKTGSDSKPYDGTPLTKDGAGITGLVNGETATVTATGTITDVGTVTNTYSIDWGTTDKDNYTVTEDLGTLEITKANMTVEAVGYNNVYDGAVHEGGATPSVTEGTTLKYSVDDGETWTETVPSIQNVGIVRYKVKATNPNYNDATADGTLIVTPRPVTFSGVGDEKVYNGATQKVETVNIKNGDKTGLVEGHSHNVEFSAEGIDAGTYTGTITAAGAVVIKDAYGTDVTGNYQITTENADLVISKASLTIAVNDQEYTYNGSPQGENNAVYEGDTILSKVEVEGLVGGDALSKITLNGQETNVGEYEGKIAASECAVNFNHETTKTIMDNYDVTYASGKLMITQASLTVKITGNTDSKKYNGETQEVTGFTAEAKGDASSLAAFDEDKIVYNGDATASGKDVNDDGYPMGLDIRKFSYSDPGVEVKFELVSDGHLTITPRSVTLTSASAEKQYDGNALTKNAQTDITVSGDGFVNGEGATYTITGSQTVVGFSENEFAYTLNEGTLEQNYTITPVNGTLTVTNRDVKFAIEVEGNSKSVKYNGTEQTLAGIKTDTFRVEENTYTVSGLAASGSGTKAGEYPVNVTGTPTVRDSNGNDVTDQFAVTPKPGTLTIQKRDVTLTSADGEKQYDGTALTKNAQSDVAIDGDGFVDGEGATYAITGSQTVVGESKNAFTYTLNEGTLADNYNIETKEGTLKVTDRTEKYKIEVESNSATAVYDGTSKTAQGFTKDSYTVEGNTYTVEGLTASVSGIDADKYTNEITGTAVVKDAAGNDVTGQFTVTTKEGELEITKRPVTFTGETATKKYTGSEIELTGVTLSSGENEGLVSGHKDNVTYSAKGTEVGDYDGTITAKGEVVITADGEDVTANYDIATTPGTLTIEKTTETLTVTLEGKSYVYDGESHALPNEATTNAASGKTTIEYSKDGETWTSDLSSLTATDVADSCTIKVRATNPNYAKKATGEAELKITPKAVTVKAQDKAFTYTGEAQSWPEYDVDGLVGDDSIEAEITGSITFVSESPVTNKVESYEFAKGTPGNYTVSTKDGELTMTKADVAITITAADDEWTYDGENHQNKKVEVTEGQLLKGDSLVAEATGSVKDVTDTGFQNNPVAEGYKVMHGDEDVTSNYAITAVAGTLTINPLEVKVTAQDHEFTYTGEAQSWPKYDMDPESLIGGDEISVTVEGSITTPGQNTVENKVTYAEIQVGNPRNYKITTESGKLSIKTNEKAASVTITAADDEWTYDGASHQNKKVEVTEGQLLTGDTLVAEATGSVKNAADTAEGNNPVADGYKIMHGMGDDAEDVTALYDITAVAGTLTINSAKVTVTADPQTKTYREADPKLTATVDGLKGDDDESVIKYTLSREEGEDVGKYTITASGEKEQGNYEVEFAEGTFEITKGKAEDIGLDTEGYSGKYDGDSHGPDSTVGVGDGTTIYYSTVDPNSDDFSDNDWSTNAPTWTDFTDGAQTVYIKAENPNYETATATATVNITKRNLTLTSESATKVYDGKALTNHKVKVSGDGFADGESAAYTFSGSRTNAGTSRNTFDVVDKNGRVMKLQAEADAKGIDEQNYDITKRYGTLTVTKAPLTITTSSASKAYDGKSLTAEAKVDGLVNGETVTVNATGSQTEVGSSKNTYSLKWNGTASESNYEITEHLGTLTITASPSDNVDPDPGDNGGKDPSGGKTTPTNDPGRRGNGGNTPTAVNGGTTRTNGALTASTNTSSASTVTGDQKTDKAPQDITEIKDQKTPLAKTQDKWALLNLILMILTVLLCLWMVAGTLRRNQDADRNEDEKTVKRKKILKLLSLIPAIAAVIAFILTEDMTLPMQMTDKWTILMLIIFIVQAIMRILTKNKKDEENNNKNAYA